MDNSVAFVMINLNCNLETRDNHLGMAVVIFLIRLIEAGGPTFFGWHYSMAWGARLSNLEKGSLALAAITLCFDCVCGVTLCL